MSAGHTLGNKYWPPRDEPSGSNQLQFLGFFRSLLDNPSPEVSVVAILAASDPRSSVAANLDLIQRQTGLDPWAVGPGQLDLPSWGAASGPAGGGLLGCAGGGQVTAVLPAAAAGREAPSSLYS